MNWQSQITSDPNILVGKPTIKGTRLAVEFIIYLLAQGWSTEEVLRNYPGIAIEDIQACLSDASASLQSDIVLIESLAKPLPGRIDSSSILGNLAVIANSPPKLLTD